MFKWWLMASAPVWSGADGGGGGGGDTAEAVAVPAGGDAAPAAAAADPAARPEWMPETFWRNGAGDYEGLAKAYNEIRSAYSGKEDAIRAKVTAEMRTGVPENPDGYKLEVDPSWLPPGYDAKLVSPDDPLLAAAKPILHKLGAKQEDFQALTKAFVGWQLSSIPNVEKEKQALGENAEARLSAVDAFLAKNLAEPEYHALADAVMTAPGVAAIEKLMLMLDKPQPGSAGPQGTGQASISGEKAQDLMMHADYNHPLRGAEMRAAVQKFISSGGRVPGYRRVGEG